MLNVKVGVFHLLAFTVVIGKRPVLHRWVSKAPAFQISHSLTVVVGLLLRRLPVDALLLTAAGMGQLTALQRRGLHAKLFRSAALAAVQKAILAGVILLPWRHLGKSIQDTVKVIHRLSSSLQE